MRMHRGSSKGTAASAAAAPEILPLSASPSPPPPVRIRLEFLRAGASSVRELSVPAGTRLRDLLRSLGQSPEGCAVFRGERPLPLDLALHEGSELTVIPTFSGG
jgi:sulfur carrier protein ThiS